MQNQVPEIMIEQILTEVIYHVKALLVGIRTQLKVLYKIPRVEKTGLKFLIFRLFSASKAIE